MMNTARPARMKLWSGTKEPRSAKSKADGKSSERAMLKTDMAGPKVW